MTRLREAWEMARDVATLLRELACERRAPEGPPVVVGTIDGAEVLRFGGPGAPMYVWTGRCYARVTVTPDYA